MSTISEQLVGFVDDVVFSDLRPEVIHKTKQILLDTLGCTFGGINSEAAKITRKALIHAGQPREARVLGFSKASVANAALMNGVALRYLDYLDYIDVATGDDLQPIHPSELIPAILAVAERERMSGKDVLLAIHLGCEIAGRMCEFLGDSSLARKGWHHSTLGYLIVPVVIGKMLKLSSEKTTNAIGISGSQATLGIIDTEGEPYNMMKNMAFPWSAYTGLIAVELAAKGFTGARRIIEGNKGFLKTVLKSEGQKSRLLDPKESWTMQDRLKPYPTCGAALGLVDACIKIAERHEIKTDDIKSITVRSNKRTVPHVGDPAKRYPLNKETADHSGPFLVALALTYGRVTPDLFTPEMYANKRLKGIIPKVQLVHDANLDKPELYPAAEVEINTADSRYVHRTTYVKGHPTNPMTDDEVKKKFFMQMEQKSYSKERAQQIADLVYRLDKLRDISDLMGLLSG